MRNLMSCVCIATLLAAVSPIAFAAADDSAPKRPHPSTIQFIEGYGEQLSPGSYNMLGRLLFHRINGVTNVEYVPSERPDPSATKIVLLCIDNGQRLELAINRNFLGPVPACDSLSSLRFAAE